MSNFHPADPFHLLYPFASHWHDRGGLKYHYLDEGAGPPVVMVHGNPTWSFFFRGPAAALRDKYRCLVPDHMGMGYSDKPRDYSYTLSTHIDNMEDWLEKTLPPVSEPHGKVTLFLHDWGGPIGMGYAIRRPERVARLILMNTAVFGAERLPRRIALVRIPGLGALLAQGLNAFARSAARMTTVKKLPAEVRAGYVRPYNSWANRVGTLRFVQDVPRKPDAPSWKEFQAIETALPGFRDRPTLILWGEQDWCFTPWFLDEWKKRLPEAQIEKYPEGGHYLTEDEGPAVMARLRAFLAATE